MDRRKIQLIAGTTYSITLPKDWVRKNNLREKMEVLVQERGDRNLLISSAPRSETNPKEMSLDVDKHGDVIEQMLFGLYYLGVETITLNSKTEISKEVRGRIRRTLNYMSGTEINYEDRKKISVRVLLDCSKVSITQTLYRITLLIDLSLASLIDHVELEEIDVNEDEVDRLYHLMMKVASVSLIDSAMLRSSGIGQSILIPSYVLVSKKLENISDDVLELARRIGEGKPVPQEQAVVLSQAKAMMSRIAKAVTAGFPDIYDKTSREEVRKMTDRLGKVVDVRAVFHLENLVRYIVDIEDELVNISSYSQLAKDGLL
ncbi:MAG: AbrB/MazE/SpoVT family DNA-binding domain-containing protein [archaeon]